MLNNLNALRPGTGIFAERNSIMMPLKSFCQAIFIRIVTLIPRYIRLSTSEIGRVDWADWSMVSGPDQDPEGMTTIQEQRRFFTSLKG